jgi:hypothetical protein
MANVNANGFAGVVAAAHAQAQAGPSMSMLSQIAWNRNMRLPALARIGESTEVKEVIPLFWVWSVTYKKSGKRMCELQLILF